MKYLLDTNVLSEPTKRTPDAQIIALLDQHEDSLATAAVVIHEFMFGCLRLPPSKRRNTLQGYLESTVLTKKLGILPYDQQAAAWHAHERSRLSLIGRLPQFVDGQIAAIARTNNLILVTRNTSDFQHFKGLEMENWFSK